jgi:hypothetical protein
LLLAITSASFALLRFVVAKQHKADATLSRAHKQLHVKDVSVLLLYITSVPLAFVSIKASFFIFILIPSLYFLPDRRIEEA